MTAMLAAFMAPGQNKTKNRRARREGACRESGRGRAKAKAKAQRGISRCVSLDLSGPMAAVTSCGLSFLLRFIAFASVSPRHDEVQEVRE